MSTITDRRLISIETVGAWVVAVLLAWNGYVGWKMSQVGEGLISAIGEIKTLQKTTEGNQERIKSLEQINADEYKKLKNGR